MHDFELIDKSLYNFIVLIFALFQYFNDCSDWIFLWIEIANPEIWKSEFRYSEIVFFVLDYLSISMRILVKALPHLRCVAAFTNILIEIIFRYAQKWS